MNTRLYYPVPKHNFVRLPGDDKAPHLIVQISLLSRREQGDLNSGGKAHFSVAEDNSRVFLGYVRTQFINRRGMGVCLLIGGSREVQ